MFLGIDLGTSSMKCLLVDDEQKILSSVSSNIEISNPKSGWSEQNPKFWIDALDDCLKTLSQKNKISEIKAISFSGHMHGATCLDKDFNIIRPCILWNDTRSFDECETIMKDRSVLDISGNLAMPGFTAPKLLWMKKNEPKKFNQVAKVLLPKDYLRFILTGEFYSDLSDASGTYWLDVGKREWSKKLLDDTHMNISQMPNLCEGTEQTGIVNKHYQKQYGFNNNCKVYGGAGDNAAAAVGLGIFEEGNVSLSLGTSGVIFASTNSFLKNYEEAIHSFCHCLPNTWHLMSVMLSCTSNINWFIDTFNSSIKEINLELENLMKNYSDVKNFPFFLPYLSGERTPINDPHIRASFHDMGIETTRVSLIYSLIEGISFGLKDNYEALKKTNIKLDNIYVIGGGSNSRYWIKLLANILNRDLLITEASDTMAAFGAARLAFMGYNKVQPNEILSNPRVIDQVKPNHVNDMLINTRYQKWKTFYLN